MNRIIMYIVEKLVAPIILIIWAICGEEPKYSKPRDEYEEFGFNY